MNKIRLTQFESENINAVKDFTDQWIGLDYFSCEDLRHFLLLSQKDGWNASFLAWEDQKLIGVRLTLAPSTWISAETKIQITKWNVDADKVGYFKSLFIDENYRAQGLGKLLSAESKKILLKQGAQAIVTHSWLESPGNSSQNYLLKDGFTEVSRYANFWEPIDYECVRCTPKRCQCTAVEMIKYISDVP